MIVFQRWVRAKRIASHLGPVEWTLRPPDSTWITLGLLISLYLLVLVGMTATMGPIGGAFVLIVTLLEARSVAYELDERVEIRGDVLVAHHYGHIEAFRREDIATVVRDDHAFVGNLTTLSPLGSIAAVLRLETVDGRTVEIWRCRSTERARAELDPAVDIIEIWRLERPERSAGQYRPAHG